MSALFNHEQPSRINPWKILTITIVVILFLVGLWFSFIYVSNNYYTQGFNAGATSIVTQQTQQGICYYVVMNEQTQKPEVKYISLKGLNGE